MPRGILVPRPGIKPAPLALEVQSLNHWTAREVPGSSPTERVAGGNILEGLEATPIPSYSWTVHIWENPCEYVYIITRLFLPPGSWYKANVRVPLVFVESLLFQEGQRIHM